MVHRITKVLADLDDRVLPPDAARSSVNMRFAASVGNTNLAMTLVNGMSEINYTMPSGDNKVIGVREDFESQSVFFALWNHNPDTDEHDHGIYRIQGTTIERVIGGEILNFDEDSDVSMAIIDGKIYWTDNVNQPRMCNVAKGIAGDYPDPLEEWMITQIKRQPGLPLYVVRYDFDAEDYTSVDLWSKTDASNDYSIAGINVFNNDIPFEFSYYYIYDNDEESTIAPYSTECYYTKNVQIRLPGGEITDYLLDLNLIKRIVFIYRQGNDAPWYVVKSNPNNSASDYFVTIEDLLSMPKISVSGDIVDRSFDAVPLKSTSNEIAQNRINHSNYLIDYDTVTGLTFTATPVAATYNANPDAQTINKVHKPGARYNVGVELLDEWGRKIGVINQIPVTIPTYQNFAVVGDFDEVPVNQNQDWQNNSYWINWTLSGTVPSWVKYYRVVESTALNVVSFYRFTSIILYWYQGDDGLDYLSRFYLGEIYRQLNTGGSFNAALDFYHKGYSIYLPTGSPINFTTNDETFVVIIGNYSYEVGSPVNYQFDADRYGQGREFKISKQVNNVLYFELKGDIILEPAPPAAVDYGLASELTQDPSFFQFEITTKTKSPSDLYYQNDNIFIAINNGLINATGTLYGDAYLAQFKKTFNPFFTSFIESYDGSTDYIRYVIDPNSSFPFRGGQMTGVCISMNPTNIYDQNWNPQKGQENIVNEGQRQTRLLQGIAFSSSLIQGTQINGLSKFNSVDNRQAPLENGPITALVRTNATQREPGVLLAIGKNGVSSFYYDGIQLTNIDGTANVSTSDKYLASQRPLVGNYGAEKLRNICATPLGTVYYWSEGIKDWIRYTNAGLEQLGETYQFMNLLRNELDDSTSVFVTYDQVTDEAILVGNSSNAYVFSERYKTFQGGRQYRSASNVRPERGATLSTRTFFFLEGHVWQMTTNGTPNSFFGTVRKPSLTVVTNESPTVMKRWNSIRVYGPRPQLTILNTDGTEAPAQSSYIDEGWWVNRKGDWDAAIRRDANSTGGVMGGKVMESRILIFTFVWETNNFDKLNYLEVVSNKSLVQ